MAWAAPESSNLPLARKGALRVRADAWPLGANWTEGIDRVDRRFIAAASVGKRTTPAANPDQKIARTLLEKVGRLTTPLLPRTPMRARRSGKTGLASCPRRVSDRGP